MKLDKDAIRSILLAIESDTGNPMIPKDIEIPGLSQQETAYHVELLAEAGFLEAKRLVTFQLYDWKPTRLTYAGHEFLDTVRDNEIWRLTKEGAQKVGAHSVTFLFEVGKAILKQKAVEHGIHF